MQTLNPDFEDYSKARVNFNFTQFYKDLEPPMNLIIEMRKFDPAVPNSLKSVAWTIF